MILVMSMKTNLGTTGVDEHSETLPRKRDEGEHKNSKDITGLTTSKFITSKCLNKMQLVLE